MKERTGNLLYVSSRLVRRFKADDVERCPQCGLLPVEITFTSSIGVTHHRFECPHCDNPEVRWDWSHERAAASWGDYARTHNA